MEREKEDLEEVERMLNELSMELCTIKQIISLHLGVSDGKDWKVEDASNVGGDSKETEEGPEILKKQDEVAETLLDSSNRGVSVDIENVPANIEGQEEDDEVKFRDPFNLINYDDDEELEWSIEWRNGA